MHIYMCISWLPKIFKFYNGPEFSWIYSFQCFDLLSIVAFAEWLQAHQFGGRPKSADSTSQ